MVPNPHKKEFKIRRIWNKNIFFKFYLKNNIKCTENTNEKQMHSCQHKLNHQVVSAQGVLILLIQFLKTSLFKVPIYYVISCTEICYILYYMKCLQSLFSVLNDCKIQSALHFITKADCTVAHYKNELLMCL
jgi:hypothetical protein